MVQSAGNVILVGHVEFEVHVAWQPNIFGILYTEVWLTEGGQEKKLQTGFPSDTDRCYTVEAFKKKKKALKK